jgi:hypothetical protein
MKTCKALTSILLGIGTLALSGNASLVLHYTFDNDTIASPIGDTVIENSAGADGGLREWNDASASASFSSTVPFVPAAGSSISFNNTAGSSGGVLISTPFGVTTAERTFAAWINTSFSTVDQIIAHWGDDASGPTTGEKYTIRLNTSGQLRLEIAGAAIVGTANVATGDWVHLAVRQTANSLGNVEFYINGSLETLSSTSTATISTSSSSLYIGAERTSGNNAQRFFSGLMDDVRLYDSALTPTEISSLALVPEPSTYALLLGFVALGGVLLRRRLRS